jgi:hypothetical protein
MQAPLLRLLPNKNRKGEEEEQKENEIHAGTRRTGQTAPSTGNERHFAADPLWSSRKCNETLITVFGVFPSSFVQGEPFVIVVNQTRSDCNLQYL